MSELEKQYVNHPVLIDGGKKSFDPIMGRVDELEKDFMSIQNQHLAFASMTNKTLGALRERIEYMEKQLDVGLKTINTIIGMLSDELAKHGTHIKKLEESTERYWKAWEKQHEAPEGYEDPDDIPGIQSRIEKLEQALEVYPK